MKKTLSFCLSIFCIIVLTGCASSPQKETKAVSVKPAQQTSAAQATSASPAEPAAPGTPRLEIAESTYDFGQLVEDKAYMHEFKFKNTGTATLEIKKVVPG